MNLCLNKKIRFEEILRKYLNVFCIFQNKNPVFIAIISVGRIPAEDQFHL